MSSSSEATPVPAEKTERPFTPDEAQAEAAFTPSPDGSLGVNARTFLRDKIGEVRGGEGVAVHVESSMPGPDDTLVVSCMADRDAFDVLTRAGVNVAGYRYQRPFERFTATLRVSEISAAISRRASVAVDDGSDCEYAVPGDEEETLG